MIEQTMPPPAIDRCQIYREVDTGDGQHMIRCANKGTHWVKWPGLNCDCCEGDVCMDDFFSWECDDALHRTRPGDSYMVSGGAT